MNKITPEMALRLRNRGWTLPIDRGRYEENSSGERLHQIALEMKSILDRLNELDFAIKKEADGD